MAQTIPCDTEEVILHKTLTIRESANITTTDFPPKNFHMNNSLDILIFLISIISLIVDIAFDIHLAFVYYRNGDTLYFSLTALFILFPALVNTVISLRMYVMDKECDSVSKVLTRKWLIRFVMLFFQLAPILRYCDCLDYALKARRAEKEGDRVNQKKYHEMMLKEDSDVALLRVFECFLEAAPQAILQTTILLISNQSQSETLVQVFHQVVSIITSLFSMAWSMASYHRLVRVVQVNKDNMSYAGTAMQFMWHFMITVSRILAISGVASIFPEWAASACGVHWMIMTVWLLFLEGNSFCAPEHDKTVHWKQKLGEVLFCSILGLVFIFTYLTLADGPTRQKYMAYYPLCFIENVLLAMIWYTFAKEPVQATWYFYPFFILSIVPFVVGIAFMLAYYRCFHPRRSTPKPMSTPRPTPRNTPRIPRKIESIIGVPDSSEDER